MSVSGIFFVERQELAAELTRLRHRAGLSGQAIAERLGVSQSKISKMENGHIAITVEEAKQWGRAVGCDQGTIEELGRRADTALTEMISWRGSRHLSDVLPKFQRNIGALEHTATLVQEFQTDSIPGLLQTAEYARQVFLTGYPEGRPDIGPAIAARMERQSILYEEGRCFEFVITEPVLRWRLGPTSMMLAQLDRLRTVGTLSNTFIGVIPVTRPLLVWHSHGFVIYENEEDRTAMVQVETLTADLNISEVSDIQEFRDAYRHLREMAVVGRERDELIAKIAEDIERSE